MKTIYMSVEKDFEKTPEHKYRTSKLISKKLNEKYNLILVTPQEYNLTNKTIKAGYKFNGSTLQKVLNEHEPKGELFIIYGDETSKNLGLEFGRNQYTFLKEIQKNKNFDYFFNKPETEEATLKDKLVELHQEYPELFARTFFYENKKQIKKELFDYGSLIIKPIFGCASSGVNKIQKIDEIENIASEDFIRKNYVFQQPLSGIETRIIILDSEFIGSRQDENYQPWSQKTPETSIGKPTQNQIQQTKLIAERINADLIGVDFMDNKIYEINGTGTGLLAYDQKSNLLFDYTSKFLEFIDKKLI